MIPSPNIKIKLNVIIKGKKCFLFQVMWSLSHQPILEQFKLIRTPARFSINKDQYHTGVSQRRERQEVSIIVVHFPYCPFKKASKTVFILRRVEPVSIKDNKMGRRHTSHFKLSNTTPRYLNPKVRSTCAAQTKTSSC